MEATLSIINEAQQYAKDVFANHIPANVCYHNLKHTQDVVQASVELGAANGIKGDDMEVLQLAAWFHDLGYSEAIMGHEDISARLALDFLSQRKYPDERAALVAGCIMATKMPQTPKNRLQEVLCDADLIHLASDDFLERTHLLKKELQNCLGKKTTEQEWMEGNIRFIAAHTYFTDYARNKYGGRKRENLKRVQEIIKEMEEPKESKPKKKKDKKPARGVETMFRLTSKNHLDLSAMADNKANIMISINAIILSILVSVLIRKLEEYPHMVIPTLILTTVSLVTIVLAILVTRPNVTLGKFEKQDILDHKVNLLFFGNFYKMKREEYEWAMKEMMKDGDYLYSNLIQDIYYLGVVLGRKYKLLRLCYTFFMFGFVISVLSFLVAELFFRSPYPY